MEEKGGSYRPVLSGFAWQGGSKFLVQGIAWANTIIVARLLAPADYGIVAIAGIFLDLMAMMMEMGLSQALTQKGSVTREEEDTVFWLGLLLGMALFALVYLSAPYVAGFYHMPLLRGIIQLCAFGILVSSVKAVPQAILMRRLDFRSRSLIEVAATIASSLTVVLLAINHFGAWSLAWGMVVQHGVTSLCYLPILGRWPRLTFRLDRIGDLLRCGLRLTGGNLSFVVSSRADVFLIGKVLGEHLAGIYAIAIQIANIPLDKLGSIFNQVAFPAIARVKDEPPSSQILIREMHRHLTFLAYPLLIGMALVADDLVVVLLGERWRQAVPILQALCMLNLMRISGMLIAVALNASGRERQALNYSVTGAVLLPMGFLAGTQSGLSGVAAAWLAIYPLLLTMLLHYMDKELAVTPAQLITDSRPTLVATAVMTGTVVIFQMMSAPMDHSFRLVASVIVGALAYVAVFLIFYGDQVARMWRALRALRGERSA